jgi:hypothetical protein
MMTTICDECEIKCRGVEACGYYQDLEGELNAAALA